MVPPRVWSWLSSGLEFCTSAPLSHSPFSQAASEPPQNLRDENFAHATFPKATFVVAKRHEPFARKNACMPQNAPTFRRFLQIELPTSFALHRILPLHSLNPSTSPVIHSVTISIHPPVSLGDQSRSFMPSGPAVLDYIPILHTQTPTTTWPRRISSTLFSFRALVIVLCRFLPTPLLRRALFRLSSPSCL